MDADEKLFLKKIIHQMSEILNAEKVMEILQLKPLTFEGGYFRRTYQAPINVEEHALPSIYQSTRSLSSAIYYLLDENSYSKLHYLPSDELLHFYLGDPVEVLLIPKEGRPSVLLLGTDLLNGHRPQMIMKAGNPFGMRLQPEGRFALLGTTMSPAFEPEDFKVPQVETLFKRFPDQRELIQSFL